HRYPNDTRPAEHLRCCLFAVKAVPAKVSYFLRPTTAAAGSLLGVDIFRFCSRRIGRGSPPHPYIACCCCPPGLRISCLSSCDNPCRCPPPALLTPLFPSPQ
ncbi:unnamed protein product, partial [Ectocarpus sp. 12 AP-2014]